MCFYCGVNKEQLDDFEITRLSVEHCTLHADGARLHFTGLSYIDFRMIKLSFLYLFPGSISPVTYKWYECRTDFEFVIPKTYLDSFLTLSR